MSSFLDCEWQHRPDDTTVNERTIATAMAAAIDPTSTNSDGALPSHVGSLSYGITSDRNGESDASHAAVAATATATVTATIKSEQAILIDDDDETADDENDNENYDDDFDFDFDFDSSDNEAVIARMKMVTKKTNKKKQTPHSSDATTNTSDRNGHFTLREELLINDNNVFSMIKEVVDEYSSKSCPVLRPRNAKSTKSTKSIASDGGFHKSIPQGTAKLSSKNSTKWKGKRQQLVDFKRKFRHTNVPLPYAENKPLGNWVNNQRIQYMLFKAKRKSNMTSERIQSLEELDFEWERSTTRTWEESRQRLVGFKRKFRHTNVPQTHEENKQLGTWVNRQRTQYKLFKAKRKSHMTRERIQSLDELDFEWEIRTITWEERCQQLADFKVKFHHTNVPRNNAENKPLRTWVYTQRYQYTLFKAKRKSNMTRERIQSLDELDFEWQLRNTNIPNSSSLVEKSLLSTEDGYESDNSESDFLII